MPLKDLEEIKKKLAYKLPRMNGPRGKSKTGFTSMEDEGRVPRRGNGRKMFPHRDKTSRAPISKSLEDLEKSIHGSTEDQFIELVKAIFREEIEKMSGGALPSGEGDWKEDIKQRAGIRNPKLRVANSISGDYDDKHGGSKLYNKKQPTRKFNRSG